MIISQKYDNNRRWRAYLIKYDNKIFLGGWRGKAGQTSRWTKMRIFD
jgi:hypothetical protein